MTNTAAAAAAAAAAVGSRLRVSANGCAIGEEASALSQSSNFQRLLWCIWLCARGPAEAAPRCAAWYMLAAGCLLEGKAHPIHADHRHTPCSARHVVLKLKRQP
jgi:hypothetical protein